MNTFLHTTLVFLPAEIRSTDEIKPKNSMTSHAVIYASGQTLERIGQTNVAVEEDNTYTWKYQAKYLPKYADCDLLFQIFTTEDRHRTLIGEASVPFEKLTADGATGDKISCPVTLLGKVEGELIISHYFSFFQQTDGSVTGEHVKMKTKMYKLLKKVALGAKGFAIAFGISCVAHIVDQEGGFFS